MSAFLPPWFFSVSCYSTLLLYFHILVVYVFPRLLLQLYGLQMAYVCGNLFKPLCIRIECLLYVHDVWRWDSESYFPELSAIVWNESLYQCQWFVCACTRCPTFLLLCNFARIEGYTDCNGLHFSHFFFWSNTSPPLLHSVLCHLPSHLLPTLFQSNYSSLIHDSALPVY